MFLRILFSALSAGAMFASTIGLKKYFGDRTWKGTFVAAIVLGALLFTGLRNV